ncbi:MULTISPECIES: phage holin family protein [unclassified Cyanobium]|uniref:phage holin family protein n=1 Tax=unclassified Cyanobium TaxID=2627006 RepID=UPI0020CD18DE|nr:MULTISPECIES: phage holin family protein [unclassified Cyanobium]MCP9778937.1 phage holin family protein [Cyanobium sp. Tous-M-B4]MCP9877576.1 phage holin family protein [Cyanobium sp. A2C-AMD]
MTDQNSPGPARVAAGRVGALLTSVMDLHVRIALQEVDREKRRLISGALLLSGGLALLLLALIGAELALLLGLHAAQGLSWIHAALAVAALNLVLAGIFLRVGGQLLKGPYLPETTAGLSKTTRAILGR